MMTDYFNRAWLLHHMQHVTACDVRRLLRWRFPTCSFQLHSRFISHNLPFLPLFRNSAEVRLWYVMSKFRFRMNGVWQHAENSSELRCSRSFHRNNWQHCSVSEHADNFNVQEYRNGSQNNIFRVENIGKAIVYGICRSLSIHSRTCLQYITR